MFRPIAKQTRRAVAMVLTAALTIGMLPAAIQAEEPSSHIVINEVYGGGGNSKAVYTHDFIELYNPGEQAVPLDGWSVQYSGATKNDWKVTTLTGSIAAGGYYLVQEDKGTGGTMSLPTPDAAGDIAMSSTNGKVALVQGVDAITSATASNVVDMVGFGTADAYETAAAPAPSNTTSINRTNGVDTNDNSKDFTTAAPTPQNSAGTAGVEVVATPQAYPLSGTAVTLTCSTADAVIHYTLDGSDPTAESPRYSADAQPTLTGDDGTSVTLKAIAIKGDVTSAVQTITYTIGKVEIPTDGPLQDGQMVILYAPAYKKALSSRKTSYYNEGTDLTVGSDGAITGYTAADVWTVAANTDGTYRFRQDGKNLGMAEKNSSMDLGAVHDNWQVIALDNDLYNIRNVARQNYMEWYKDKGNWSTFNSNKAAADDQFQIRFYTVTEMPSVEPTAGMPENGSQVVLYNVGSQGVLAGPDGNETSPSICHAAATVNDGTAVPSNGARIFTVEQNGAYYRFHTNDGYLCSNGTGNNAYYAQEASDNADWTVSAFNGGFNLKSRTAKFKDKFEQYLEYYGGTYKSYSLQSNSDKNIYTFHFYPVAKDVTVTDQVVNEPTVTFGTLSDAYMGRDCTVTFTVDAVFGVKEITAKYGGHDAQLTEENGTYSFTIPSAELQEGKLAITVWGTDNKGVHFEGTAQLTVLDEPVIDAVFPAANTQTGNEKRPEIGVTFINAGERPEVTMTINGKTVAAAVKDGRVSYTPDGDLEDGRTTVTVTVTRSGTKSVSRTWSFTVGKSQYQLYFGQLHSHTTYSDGAGTLDAALEYVSKLPEDANVDFVAFTDHSNYFDQSGDANSEDALYNPEQMTAYSRERWNTYNETINAFNEKQSDVVALPGFEMTWSGGPGHINTFNSPGVVSRNNKTLNDKTADAGMRAYYALLSRPEGANTISQFNHPGSTFGTFADFGYYDAIIDSRMYLVEVGNGEGAIGAGGYYPSYSYYTMALDKGWHLAPSNNQDNHKGGWGNANDARDVILTDNFTKEGIYEAIRNYRVYATEDRNLEIRYTLNGQMMGSIIPEVPEEAHIQVTVYDPNPTDTISRVEVVVNSGAVAYTWNDPKALAAGELTCTIPANYSYYYIRVIQGDGDIAVTAPVWTGETVKLGISSVECGTSTPVTDEALTLTTTLFNSEQTAATVRSITFTSGGQTLGTVSDAGTLEASSTLKVDWSYTPTVARLMTITATVVLERNGISYTYTKDIALDVQDASKLLYIGIDASHANEYVAGNYKDSMGNFSNLAAGYSVRTVILKTTDDLLTACRNENGKYVAIILTAPSRRDGTALRKPYFTYEENELQALKQFNEQGGTLVLAGWSDYYENYGSFKPEDHMAAQQNKVLAALGSSLRIGDDATNDDTLNGGQAQRLYFSTYNWDNFLMEGVEFDSKNPNNNLYSQLFSQYGGASVYVVDGDGQPTSTLPATVSPVVYGHATTYSTDSDKDGLGGASMPKYAVGDNDSRLMVLATEQLEGRGLIVVSGAAFLSNFEVQAQIGDSGAEKNYSNYKICQNLVQYLNPVTITPIAQVQAQPLEGVKYTIEGVVTSNASGHDKDTAFFDCIYLQDATGGINAFPVAGNFKVGDRVRITGSTSSYQGERQIAVSTIEKIGTAEAPAPRAITAAQLNDGSVLGQLVTMQGTVVSYESSNGLIQTILVRDSSGNVGRVFIDGYITTSRDVEKLTNGCTIRATGLASYDNTFNAPEGPFPRIRVRDRVDIVCTETTTGHTPSSGTTSGSKTETTRNADGSTTTTVTKADGSKTAATKAPNGSASVVSTDKNGKVRASVTVSSSAVTAAKDAVALSMPAVKATADTAKAPTITVALPTGTASVRVTIPVKNATTGTVAVLVKANGTEEIVKTSAATRDGVVVQVSNGDTVKIVDNTRSFNDVPKGYWGAEAVAFAASRELFKGTGPNTFSPEAPMTRAMFVTVLARLEGVDTAAGTTWYVAGQKWAMEQGISDGTNLMDSLTREQLATMLYRYSGSPAVTGAITGFSDADTVSSWASDAMTWAVQKGILNGSNGMLNARGAATRAQVAAMLMRFLEANA